MYQISIQLKMIYDQATHQHNQTFLRLVSSICENHVTMSFIKKPLTEDN